MQQQHRLIARAGLGAALFTLTLSMLVLARPALMAQGPAAEIGKTAPGFTLPSTAGAPCSLAQYHGRPVLLFFGSDNCPVSKRYAGQLLALQRRHPDVAIVAINSNTDAHAIDPASLALTDAKIPTLLDPMAQVARAYGATITPTFCVIDSTGILRYSGAFDNGAPKPSVERQYVARALDRLAEGVPCEITSTQAFGQTIPWVK